MEVKWDGLVKIVPAPDPGLEKVWNEIVTDPSLLCVELDGDELRVVGTPTRLWLEDNLVVLRGFFEQHGRVLEGKIEGEEIEGDGHDTYELSGEEFSAWGYAGTYGGGTWEPSMFYFAYGEVEKEVQDSVPTLARFIEILREGHRKDD